MSASLRGARIDLGLTLTAVAGKIEVNSGMLSEIERGHRPAPRYVVERLAAALGLEVSEVAALCIRAQREHRRAIATQELTRSIAQTEEASP
jgi:transcriptional regulator with XRE-family HTH domain